MKAASFITESRERGRFLRFAVVGAIGAVVDFGTFNILTTQVHMEPIYAQSISFVVAVFNNFTWNRFWTYSDSRSKPLKRQLFQFFVVNTIGLAIRTPIFSLLEKPLAVVFTPLSEMLPEAPFFDPVFLGHNFALGAAVIVVMMWNFFVNRYWTYNDVE